MKDSGQTFLHGFHMGSELGSLRAYHGIQIHEAISLFRQSLHDILQHEQAGQVFIRGIARGKVRTKIALSHGA
jgi:hypothetical protein